MSHFITSGRSKKDLCLLIQF